MRGNTLPTVPQQYIRPALLQEAVRQRTRCLTGTNNAYPHFIIAEDNYSDTRFFP